MTTASLPWYRQTWPWLIISGPAIAVIGSLASAYLAVQGADPIIEDNYYQRGLEINSTLERVRHAADLGIRASVEYDGVARGESIWVRVRAAQPLHDTALQIRLIHPTLGGADRQAVLSRVPNSADTDAEFTGQWLEDAAVAPTRSGRTQAIDWRIALQARDWQVEGDALGRSDIQAH